jgi:hypothetical protein
MVRLYRQLAVEQQVTSLDILFCQPVQLGKMGAMR